MTWYNGTIPLGDDLKIRASKQVSRRLQWNGEDEPLFVTLSNTLVAPEVSLGLLSVPALVNKGLAVLFVQERALIINMNDCNKVVSTA